MSYSSMTRIPFSFPILDGWDCDRNRHWFEGGTDVSWWEETPNSFIYQHYIPRRCCLAVWSLQFTFITHAFISIASLNSAVRRIYHQVAWKWSWNKEMFLFVTEWCWFHRLPPRFYQRRRSHRYLQPARRGLVRYQAATVSPLKSNRKASTSTFLMDRA